MAQLYINKRNQKLLNDLKIKYPDYSFSIQENTPDVPDGFMMTISDGRMYSFTKFTKPYSKKRAAAQLVRSLQREDYKIKAPKPSNGL